MAQIWRHGATRIQRRPGDNSGKLYRAVFSQLVYPGYFLKSLLRGAVGLNHDGGLRRLRILRQLSG